MGWRHNVESVFGKGTYVLWPPRRCCTCNRSRVCFAEPCGGCCCRLSQLLQVRARWVSRVLAELVGIAGSGIVYPLRDMVFGSKLQGILPQCAFKAVVLTVDRGRVTEVAVV